MPQKMIDYIHSMRLLSWAMCDDLSFEDENLSGKDKANLKQDTQNKPFGVYTASAFYAFDEKDFALLIASHENTKHIHLAKKFNLISINIAKDSSIATLKGLQMTGIFKIADSRQEKIYYEKFAFARLSGAKCFALNINDVKMTDNLSFTKKLEWQRS